NNLEIILLILLIVVILICLYLALNIKSGSGESIEKSINKIDSVQRDEFYKSREESGKNLKDFRDEISVSFKNLNDSITKFVVEITKLNDDRFSNIQNDFTNNAKITREELSKALKSFEDTIENRLKGIQDDNSLKLEKMRETVDEKLQSTLEKRLGESFKIVSDRLEQVHRGLGDMQNLATGVGDLKKVLSNAKAKGVLGELQLHNLLEQILTNEQFGRNVKTKQGSSDNVEFAVKLPGRDEKEGFVWLPVDSKFPTEDYQNLVDAYDKGDVDSIESSKKQLAQKIRTFAKSINDKYLDPPNTTDFGIMFLPYEGLYAEVLRIPGLFEQIQRELKITITGPTTFS